MYLLLIKINIRVSFLKKTAVYLYIPFDFNPHLGMKPVECHYRSKEEEWEVEVVFHQV